MRILIVIFSAFFFLSACGGGGSKVETQQEFRTTTTGQELLDLKKARDAGAISNEEYEKQRTKILKRSDG